MALTLGDVVQLKLNGVAAGEVTQNVYYYQALGSSADVNYLTLFAAAFRAAVVLNITPVVVATTAFGLIEMINLTNGLDFASQAGTNGGGISGAALPPQDVFSVQLQRSSRLTRNGYKRYSGLSENLVSDLGVIGWVTATKSALEAAHSSNIVVSTATPSFTMQPVIVGRFKQGTPNAGELDLSKINRVASARAGLFVSSQVSRRFRQRYT